MVSLEVGIGLVTVMLGGVAFIAAYRVFSFFRRTSLSKPLGYLTAAFYLFFLSIVSAAVANEFNASIPLATEALRFLFFLSATYGLYSFYRAYPALGGMEARVEKTVEKIEEDARVEEFKKKKRRVETELKIIKMRFLKREMNGGVFGKLWADKERELAEIQAELQMLKGAEHG